MYYTIYQTTNLVNGKTYIGSHKTKDLEDEYMGSGKILLRAIEKYGIENFIKKIIKVFDNSEEMFELEATLVNEDYIIRKDTYNIKTGGFGGFEYINANGLANNKEHGKLGSIALSERLNTNINFKERFSNTISKNMIKRHATGELKKSYFGQCEWHHKAIKNAWSEDVAKKRAKTKKQIKFQQGELNSQFNTCWICHETKGNKKIKKELLENYLQDDWLLGKIEKHIRLSKERIAKQEKKKLFTNSRTQLAKKLRDEFVKLNYTSIRKFIRDGHHGKSPQALIDLWRKYIPDFDPGYKT